MFNEDVQNILRKRVLLHPEDPKIEEVWIELADKLGENEDNTINFLLTCSSKEVSYISEVFEDISLKLKSKRFIDILRELAEKYPQLNMESDITLAEEYSNY